MKQIFKVFILVFFIFSGIPIISEANAHSLFNSSEETLGDYRVQIATLPEFPQIGERSEILIRVTDNQLEEVDRFTMGARIFYNDEQITTWRPQSYEDGHMQKNFIFEEAGNHIFRIDLYDAGKDGGVLTYTFNISTQSPFGYIFIGSIAAGGIIFAAVIGLVFVQK